MTDLLQPPYFWLGADAEVEFRKWLARQLPETPEDEGE